MSSGVLYTGAMDILIATKNPGKFLEIQEMLSALDAVFHSPDSLGIEGDFEEDGETFDENALGKARFFAEKAGMLTVADDSGIFIEALADELGVKTRRWGAGHEASDEEWLAHFMERMAEEENRAAKFICAAALVSADGKSEEVVVFGETCGEITGDLEVPVKPGIPLSSVFRPEGHGKVYAALSEAEKNEISHRGKAFMKLLNILKNA